MIREVFIYALTCFLYSPFVFLQILPGVQNEDPLVRNMAIKCLGLCALLSCEFARTHLVLFLQVTISLRDIIPAVHLPK